MDSVFSVDQLFTAFVSPPRSDTLAGIFRIDTKVENEPAFCAWRARRGLAPSDVHRQTYGHGRFSTFRHRRASGGHGGG